MFVQWDSLCAIPALQLTRSAIPFLLSAEGGMYDFSCVPRIALRFVGLRFLASTAANRAQRPLLDSQQSPSQRATEHTISGNTTRCPV